MLSVIIPSYHDHLLQPTIDSLLENSEGVIEIIPVLDGYLPEVPLKKVFQVKPVYLKENRGMRGAMNAGLCASNGDFIMKSDSHCMFAPGYDVELTKSCADNWLMIPRRYSLDDDNWKRNDARPIYDYHYFRFPSDSRYGHSLSVVPCSHRSSRRKDPKYNIDDTMTFQGSCWFANKRYFMDHVGFLDDRVETYGTFAGDQPEIGLKYWLNGGETKVNKNTWYAHLNKAKRHYEAGVYGKQFKIHKNTLAGHTWAAKHWMNNEEPGMMHTLDWLIEKFWPIPGWEDNWKEIWKSYEL